MTYDELLIETDKYHVIVKEKDLCAGDGRIFGNKIAIRKNIPTLVEKSCVLAEEIGHYITSSGDIIDQNTIQKQKQEYAARLYGYNLKIGLQSIIDAYESGCQNHYEIAEYLDVTEEYLKEALNIYKSKYEFVILKDHIIQFEPFLMVYKHIEIAWNQ